MERHLDGRRGHALALAALVCLMRPELFPFLALYALWLAWAEPERRRLVGVLLVAIPVAWLVPEWIGSGDPLDGGSQARSEPYWSLSHAEQPWLRALERAHNHPGLAVELLAAAAVVAAVALRQRAVLALAAATALEAGLFVAMTQAGFSGNPRYVLPALVGGSSSRRARWVAAWSSARSRPCRRRGRRSGGASPARVRHHQSRPPHPPSLGAGLCHRGDRARLRPPGRAAHLRRDAGGRGPRLGKARRAPPTDPRRQLRGLPACRRLLQALYVAFAGI